MKRARKHAAPLLFILLFAVLLGCGVRGQAAADDGDQGEIMLSNLKTAGSELSPDEKKMLEEARSILESATVLQSAGSQERIQAVNTTEHTLRSVEIYAEFYDSEGALVKELGFDIEDWAPGEVIDAEMSSHGMGYYARYQTAKLQIQYEENMVFYRTPQVEVKTAEDSSKDRVQLTLKGGVPQKITAKDWSGKAEYEITEFSFGPVGLNSSDYYEFSLMMKKLSGNITANPGPAYRIIRDDGTVFLSRSMYDLRYLETGESMKITEDYIELPEGNYQLVFEAD